ncbi:MAG: ATP-dependent DNA helicase [Clostridia bacterium]|nr:ATP-dependent DNA helicase [Clostridia bacterium]
MRYEKESGRIHIDVTELARYAYQRENARALMERFGFTRIADVRDLPDDPEEQRHDPAARGTELHHTAETDASLLEGTQTEVPLSREVHVDEIPVLVGGYADIISFDGALHTVEEIKTVASMPRTPNPFVDPAHFAQCAVYAFLFAADRGAEAVKLKLTTRKRSNGETVSFAAVFTRPVLEKLFHTLLDRAAPFLRVFAERFTVFADEARELPFPYPSIRDGQRTFIQAAYRAMKTGRDLMVSAPTGIGKTISALFPAVKVLGEGTLDKVFYFTAKNVTGQAALDAARRIASFAPHLRVVNISAKEAVCPLKKERKELPFRMNCRVCERMDSITEDFGLTYRPYRERELAALSELLSEEDTVYTLPRLIATAEKYRVCPHELSLDLSELCMIVVCDYNYALDDNVRFRRYFRNPGNAERYAFLFDEAHNIPDRARTTYSAALPMDWFWKLTETYENSLSEYPELGALMEDFRQALGEIRAMCDESEYVHVTPDGDVSGAYCQASRVPDGLVRTAGNLLRAIRQIGRDDDEAGDLLHPFADTLSAILFASSFFDEKFRFFAHRENDRVECEILCLDPSGICEAMLRAAKSSILFSATLSPMSYFRELCGMDAAELLELDSPYEQDNLCLVSYDSISTRFTDRKSTAMDCAEVIYETISARAGNYIIYFPSYEYMKRVCRAFANLSPDCAIVMQKPGMSFRERERFIKVFREDGHGSVVGFCVLGGMFSEGIDLAGESLIGVIVFGTGMPQLSPERNLMSAYYDDKTERGFEFAYLCPGMNKVQQAAGRVIRSETDRGVIVLCDDRLGDPRMKSLFPKHWRHMKYTGDLISLSHILAEFWSAEETADKN